MLIVLWSLPQDGSVSHRASQRVAGLRSPPPLQSFGSWPCWLPSLGLYDHRCPPEQRGALPRYKATRPFQLQFSKVDNTLRSMLGKSYISPEVSYHYTLDLDSQEPQSEGSAKSMV